MTFRVSLINVNKFQENCGFVYIYLKNISWNADFFLQCSYSFTFVLERVFAYWIIINYYTLHIALRNFPNTTSKLITFLYFFGK